ncbi:hypothetical protein NY536_30695, partial [Enterobacter hormaechei]|nr:hypothetical protein [Enterobacter hormaechei]
FLTADDETQSEIAHLAASQKTRTAAARFAALAAFHGFAHGNRSDALLEMAGFAVFLDQHHRQL